MNYSEPQRHENAAHNQVSATFGDGFYSYGPFVFVERVPDTGSADGGQEVGHSRRSLSVFFLLSCQIFFSVVVGYVLGLFTGENNVNLIINSDAFKLNYALSLALYKTRYFRIAKTAVNVGNGGKVWNEHCF